MSGLQGRGAVRLPVMQGLRRENCKPVANAEGQKSEERFRSRSARAEGNTIREMRIRIIPQGTMATAESSNTQESKQIKQIKEKVHQEIEESPYCARAGKLVKVCIAKNATCTAKIILILFAVRGKKRSLPRLLQKKNIFHYLGYPIYDVHEYDRAFIKFHET